jgi:two-component system, NarL family, sensor histidine kinase DegS
MTTEQQPAAATASTEQSAGDKSGAAASPAAELPTSLPELAGTLALEASGLEKELTEIEMLLTQARAEASRHEQKRALVADRLATISTAGTGTPAEILDLNQQLVTLTHRAGLMSTSVEVLAGKHKALSRFRDSLLQQHAAVSNLVESLPPEQLTAGRSGNGEQAPALTRAVLTAQEEMRREIARSMHDGPAQSLTNIVLQAQIVERLVAADPEKARAEVGQLISMVQQTLEATKTFIFDVRPMVLDDLGLVPTLRRAARERGRRAQIPVDFESLGTDRRLPMDLESGLFRILDEAIGGYLTGSPDRVWVRLDWSDQIDARIGTVSAPRAGSPEEPEQAATGKPQKGRDKKPVELPPALVAMMDDRKADRAAAEEAARKAASVVLPAGSWREIQQRAATIGVTAKLLGDGTELHLVAGAPEAA